jgi:hypothetical protein
LGRHGNVTARGSPACLLGGSPAEDRKLKPVVA